MNRSLPLFPKGKVIIEPGEQKIIEVEAPFSDEISSLVIIKLLDKLTHLCYGPKGEICSKYGYVRYGQ